MNIANIARGVAKGFMLLPKSNTTIGDSIYALIGLGVTTIGLSYLVIGLSYLVRKKEGSVGTTSDPKPSSPPPESPIFGDFKSVYMDSDRLTQREFTALVSKYPEKTALIEDLRAAYEDDFMTPEEYQKVGPQMNTKDARIFESFTQHFPWASNHAYNAFTDRPVWDGLLKILRKAKREGRLDQLDPQARRFLSNEIFKRGNHAANNLKDEAAVTGLMDYVGGISLFFDEDSGDVNFLERLLPLKYYKAGLNNGAPWDTLPKLQCEIKEALEAIGTLEARAVKDRVENGVTYSAPCYRGPKFRS